MILTFLKDSINYLAFLIIFVAIIENRYLNQKRKT